jgi:hypothetical protein
MSTLARSITVLIFTALAASACVVDDEVATDEASSELLDEGTLFFACDTSYPDVAESWPAGSVFRTIQLPTWADAGNPCGYAVGQIEHLPTGSVQITVTGPQAAEGNPWPHLDVLEYKIYGLRLTFCSFCTSQWAELASGTSTGFALLNPHNPNETYVAYPIGGTTVYGLNYGAIRVAARYKNHQGVEYPTKIQFWNH